MNISIIGFIIVIILIGIGCCLMGYGFGRSMEKFIQKRKIAEETVKEMLRSKND